MDDHKPFQISDEDIEVAVRYLKYHKPENATRQDAIDMLSDTQSDFHQLAHQNPELLLKLQEEIDRNKKDN